MTRKHTLVAWFVDDTGLPRKNALSVGVARQYRGHLGKPENCLVVVSVSLATEEASISAAYQRCSTRLHASRCYRKEPNGMIHTGSPPWTGRSLPNWLDLFPSAPTVFAASHNTVESNRSAAHDVVGKDALRCIARVDYQLRLAYNSVVVVRRMVGNDEHAVVAG